MAVHQTPALFVVQEKVDDACQLPQAQPELAEHEALRHASRLAILQLVQARPGRDLNSIVRKVGLARTTVNHHVSMLKNANLLQETRLGAIRRFFARHAPDITDLATEIALNKKETSDLWEWLDAHPHSSGVDAVRAMRRRGWRRSTTYRRLSFLVALGWARVVRQGRTNYYRAMPQGKLPTPRRE